MDKRIFIIGSLAGILLLLAIWAYILIYGTPGSAEDAPTGSDVVSTSDSVETQRPEVSDSFLVEGEEYASVTTEEGPTLRQITTEPVAGYQFITGPVTNENESATTSHDTIHVYYSELGTGHVYKYDLQNNQRDRISNQTIQQTRAAFITPNGSRAALIRGYNNNQQLIVLDLTTTSEDTVLEQREFNVQNIALSESGDLLYTRRTDTNAVAYAYDLETNTEEQLFTFPLRNITVAWAPTKYGRHYVYQNPSSSLESTVYRVHAGATARTTIQGYNMSVINSGDIVAYSYMTEPHTPDSIQSEIKTSQGATTPIGIVINSEKCTFLPEQNILCGHDLSDTNPDQQEWLRGNVRSNDDIWRIDSTIGASRLLVSPLSETGRQIDIFNVHAHNNTIGLQNRRDSGSLWVYSN